MKRGRPEQVIAVVDGVEGLTSLVAAVQAGDARYMWTPRHASLVSELLADRTAAAAKFGEGSMDARLVAGLRERTDSLAQDHAADPRLRRDAALVLRVLEENVALRETVDVLEGRMGPAAVLPLVERMLRSAGDLLAAVVVSDGDSVDHLLTQVRLAEDRVGYERKALAGS